MGGGARTAAADRGAPGDKERDRWTAAGLERRLSAEARPTRYGGARVPGARPEAGAAESCVRAWTVREWQTAVTPAAGWRTGEGAGRRMAGLGDVRAPAFLGPLRSA
jgi:hypothetical protein